MRWYAAAVTFLVCALCASATHAQVRNFDAEGDGTSFTDVTNWSDDDEPNTAGEDAVIDAGGAFNVTLGASRTIGDLTIGSDDTLSLNSGFTLGLTGGDLVNDGVLVINTTAGAGNSILDPNTAILISGSGEIILNAIGDPTDAQIGAAPNDFSVTNGSGHTIAGSGRIITLFINNGQVTADISGLTLLLDGGAKINNGTFAAADGGILRLGTSVDNTAGTIDPNTGIVSLNLAAITGGNIAAGQVNLIGSSTINSLTTAADIDLASGQTLVVNGTIVNSGVITINDTAGSGNSFLDPNSEVTFTGPGTVRLNAIGDTADAQIGVASNDFLITNGGDHTFSGSGRILTVFTNHGQVTADVSGLTLLLDGGAKTNTGSLAASGGGILQLQAAINNTGGTIDPDTGIVSLNLAAITGGNITAGQVNVIGSSTLNALTTAADIDLVSGQTLVVNGAITNNGTITVNSDSGSGNAILDPNSEVTFTGSGAVVLNTGGSLADGQVGGATNDFSITNDVNHTFRGTGQIINPFTNDGTVSADVNGATLLLSGGIKTNNGVMDTANGGTLSISTTVNNAMGTIDPNNGLVVLSGATINGGSITAGDVLIDGTSTLNNVTTATDIDILGSRNLIVGGTITNNGVITINSNSNSGNAILDPNSEVTFTGSGAVVLNTGGSLADGQVGGATNDFSITNDVNHTFRGTGQIINPFTNDGTVSADVNGATLLLSGGIKTNNGVMDTANGGTLSIATTVDNAMGTIDPNDGLIVLSGATINGGSITTGDVLIDGTSTLNNVTTAADIDILGSRNLNVGGTITNDGIITINSNSSNGNAILDPNSEVTFTGSGAVVLNTNGSLGDGQVGGATNDFGITNDVNHTFRGTGQIINPFTNDGTVSADVDGQTLLLTGGAKTNTGEFIAIDGGIFSITGTNTLTNLAAGVLTDGAYRSIDTGAGATFTVAGGPVVTIAAGTEVELSGAAATMTFGGTSLADSLTTNGGTLRILDGHVFTMTNALTSSNVVFLGGIGLAPATLTSGGDITLSAPGGAIDGHGTVNNTIRNSGRVTADGGTLAIVGGVIDGQGGASFISIRTGATLDLSAASGDSDTDLFIHNGAGLALGANDLLVHDDYRNLNAGSGNSFNHRANVTGTGQILADPAVAQQLSGDVTDGTMSTATLDFGNTRVGTPVARSYAVNNVGATGPMLRGALQTDNAAGNGGNVTDGRLSGAGVTAANFGPVDNDSATANQEVTFDASSAGALAGQQVAVVNNFDNVQNQVLQFTGAAYTPAALGTSPTVVNLPIVHVGEATNTAAITITNDTAAGMFSEDLLADQFAATGDATVEVGSPSTLTLAAGSSDSSLTVGIDTSTAGNKTGTVTFDATSTGEVGGSPIAGLSPLALMGGSIMVNGQVNEFANADVAKLMGAGTFTMTGPNEFLLDFGTLVQGSGSLTAELGVKNDVAAPADDLNGTFSTSGAGFSFTGFGPFVDLAAGQTQGGLQVEFSTASVGMFSGQILLDPIGTNASGYSGALSQITVNLSGNVQAVPEPGTLLMAAGGLLLCLGVRRRLCS